MKGFFVLHSPSTETEEDMLFSVRHRERERVCACDRTRSADLDIANPNTDAPVLPSCGEQKETQCVQEAGADKGINPMTTNVAVFGISRRRKKNTYHMVAKAHAHIATNIQKKINTERIFFEAKKMDL